jgi:hypothetical protein
MPCYARSEDAVLALATTVTTLEDLERGGWISIVEKDGRRYLHGQHQSRANFVVDLRLQLQLDAGQVNALLVREKPAYSGKKTADIVASFRSRRPNLREN